MRLSYLQFRRAAPFVWLLLVTMITHPAASAEDPFVEGEVIVTFKPAIAADQQERTLGRHHLRMSRRFKGLAGKTRGGISLIQDKSRTTARLIAMLKDAPEVAAVEPNYFRRLSAIIPNDTEFPKLWGLRNNGQKVNFTAGTSGVDIRFTAAWRLARPDAGEVVIGILDSGVDISHPDLVSNIWTNPGEIPADGIDNDANGWIDDIHGFDFASNTARISDSGNHGTHVAGTAAAAGRNAAGVIGVGFKAKILPLKASDDGNLILTSAVLDAYDYAVSLKQAGVNIVAINASFGGGSFNFAEQTAITALRDAGIILCAAAGNESTDNDITPLYPASYNVSNIISVAALSQTNGLASFSNFGATSVDLAAPGVNIFSAESLPNFIFTTSVSVDSTLYASQPIHYSGPALAPGFTGTVINCGLGGPNEFPVEVSGNIALIHRGTLTFATKVANAMSAGAIAAVIYDNTPNELNLGGWTLDTTRNWIPALQITEANGLAIMAQLPASGTVVNGPNAAQVYQFLDGTSMACPHVAGAVAFAAMNFPAESMTGRISRILNHVTPVPALAGKTITAGRLDLLKIVDTDSDGLPDWWETDYFGNLAEIATGNPDADHFPNLQEFLSGTSPVSATSQLAFSAFSAGPGNDFNLSFPSVLDSSYKIEWSPDLSTWFTLLPSVPGTGASIPVTDPNALGTEPRRFYRISLLPE